MTCLVVICMCITLSACIDIMINMFYNSVTGALGITGWILISSATVYRIKRQFVWWMHTSEIEHWSTAGHKMSPINVAEMSSLQTQLLLNLWLNYSSTDNLKMQYQ